MADTAATTNGPATSEGRGDAGTHSSASPSLRTLHVVFLIDITGSMGSQVQGVKDMVLRFCSVDRLGIRLHIHTFTESHNGCYVTSTPLVMPQPDVVTYVADKLQLCCPPDTAVTNASGGDGPENTAAGVAALAKKFTPDDNIVCFLITDADPHHRAFGKSAEAAMEEKWLQDNGFPTDIYEVLNHVIESLNVTFVPILYKSPSAWFNQAAALSGGLVLFPESKDSALLASGLVSLLDALQTRVLHPDADVRAPRLTGFRALASSLDDFEPLEADPKPTTTASHFPVLGLFAPVAPTIAPLPSALFSASASSEASHESMSGASSDAGTPPSPPSRSSMFGAAPSAAAMPPSPPELMRSTAPTLALGFDASAFYRSSSAAPASVIATNTLSSSAADDIEASVERLLKTASGRFQGKLAVRRAKGASKAADEERGEPSADV
ncbi:hypothetical protein HK405_015646 [Cladochytrium tenue]|nr:hypothetical protein HK405_015646 [Cladochytrium tenue]